MNSEKVINSQNHQRSLKVLKIIGITIVGVVLAALFALLFGWLVMILWNWLIPEIFGLKNISYWQAFGLIVLSKILFGGINGDHSKGDQIHRKVDQRWHRWMGIDENASLGQCFGKSTNGDKKQEK